MNDAVGLSHGSRKVAPRTDFHTAEKQNSQFVINLHGTVSLICRNYTEHF